MTIYHQDEIGAFTLEKAAHLHFLFFRQSASFNFIQIKISKFLVWIDIINIVQKFISPIKCKLVGCIQNAEMKKNLNNNFDGCLLMQLELV